MSTNGSPSCGTASRGSTTFSDALCEELLEFVLDAGCRSHAETPGSSSVQRVERLMHDYAPFATWCVTVGEEASHRELGEPARPCPAMIARCLPEWLVRFPQWNSPTDGRMNARLLWNAAHLAVRLRSMEVNFAAELSAAKSEAIYHFAYGLSHELNNPLANIATRAGVLAKDEDRPDQRSLLVTIVDNAMRGCEMLGDLMIVARPPRLNLEMTPLDAFTRQLAADAQPWLESRGVRLEVDISCQRIALLDKAAFREVLWALLRNASEAMADGGCVSLAARDLAESLVQWEILDQGAGLSAQALEHCFDPYYSGREAGRGLGFGLTKAKRVVELHSGQVKLYNRPCGGCAAVVELPCALPDQRS